MDNKVMNSMRAEEHHIDSKTFVFERRNKSGFNVP